MTPADLPFPMGPSRRPTSSAPRHYGDLPGWVSGGLSRHRLQRAARPSAGTPRHRDWPPGEQVGGMTLPETDKPLLRIIANPANPAYKLLLIVGKNDTALRMAAWRLTRGNFAPQTATLDVEPQTIGWKRTMRRAGSPIVQSDSANCCVRDQSPTVSGVWHEPLRIAFRAARTSICGMARRSRCRLATASRRRVGSMRTSPC